MENVITKTKHSTLGNRKRKLITQFNQSKYLLILLAPCVLSLAFFTYKPMWGVLIAFKDYRESISFAASKWVGLKWFSMFFGNSDATRVILNTFLLGAYALLWEFTPPIIFALILNEVVHNRIRKFVQSVSYLPYFFSMVVVVGMVQNLLSPETGAVNELIKMLGGNPINFFNIPGWFRTIYITSDIWQFTGWSSIIYTAALSSIDVDLYDSAAIDGCNKLQRIWNIDIAGIAPTIITILILSVGRMLNVGYVKVFLLYNPGIYSTSDVIGTYVYRQGMQMANFSYATAVNLFQSVINLILLIGCNSLSKKISETSLW